MKKVKTRLKLSKFKIANLNEINAITGGTNGGGDPETTTKGNPQSKNQDQCQSKYKVLTKCTDSNQPQTDP